MLYCNGMDISGFLGLLVAILCILVAMTVHEFMHAYVGFRLGDTTARDGGRLSLNPVRHIDPVMTVLVPAIAWVLFGFIVLAAKPVPFNPVRVKYREFGGALIAAAGPLSNLVLAVFGALLMHGALGSGIAGQVLSIFIQLNVALFVFNLIPIPPLDGSRILYAFAPEPVQEFMERIEPYGFFIILGLIMLTGAGTLLIQLNQTVLNLLP